MLTEDAAAGKRTNSGEHCRGSRPDPRQELRDRFIRGRSSGTQPGGMTLGAERGTRGLRGEIRAHSNGGKRLDIDAEATIGYGPGPTIGDGGSIGAQQMDGESTQPFMFLRPGWRT